MDAARGPPEPPSADGIFSPWLNIIAAVELTHREKTKRENHPTKALNTPLPLSTYSPNGSKNKRR